MLAQPALITSSEMNRPPTGSSQDASLMKFAPRMTSSVTMPVRLSTRWWIAFEARTDDLRSRATFIAAGRGAVSEAVP